MNYRYLAGALALSAAIATAACGDDPPPTQPTPAPTPPPPPPANPVLTAPTVPTHPPRTSSCRRCVRRCVVLQRDRRPGRTRALRVPGLGRPRLRSRPVHRTSARHYRLVAAQAGIPEGRRRQDATFDVAADLQPTTRFYWRARARQGTVDGPWSATVDVPHARSHGYNRARRALRSADQLAPRSAQVVGSVTLTPGRGATINSNESHIRYQPAADGHGRRVLDGSRRHPEQLARRQDEDHVDVRRQRRHHDQRLPHDGREARRRHHRLALHRRRDRQPRNADRDDRQRARRRSTSTRRRPTSGARPGAAASSASRSSTAARPPTGSTSSARATTAPTIRRRTWPTSARRSGAAVRTTRRSSARPGATSTWARPPGRGRPRWARRSSRIRARIRASRTAASAPPTSRAPRHELEAPAPSRGPALFSFQGLRLTAVAHGGGSVDALPQALPAPCARRRPPATPANGPRGG